MDALGTALLQLARSAIVQWLSHAAPEPAIDVPAALNEPGATFVTLTQQGELRGCMGSLEAWRPLRDDVSDNAVAAALRDPRFAPLSLAELPGIRVEVSLLSSAQAMAPGGEIDTLARLRPGIDGVILQAGQRRATFLPQVWEQLPAPAQFLAQLKRKAGLPVDYWSDQIRLFRYTVRKWHETGHAA